MRFSHTSSVRRMRNAEFLLAHRWRTLLFLGMLPYKGKKDEYRDKLHLFLAVLPPLPRHLMVSARLGGEVGTLRRSVPKMRSAVKMQRNRHDKHLLRTQNSTLPGSVHRQNWYGRVHSL